MKKLCLIVLAVVFGTSMVWSQTTSPGHPNCTCNPNGWQPITALIGNTSRAVSCGYQFSLKCNEKITLRGDYKCLGSCATKYSAVLKNAAGAVVMNYPVFIFPWSYSFAVAGNYSLEITPICGTTKCTPCRFFFTVTCTTAVCECDPNGWKPFIAYFNNGASKQTVNCGFQFGIKKQQPFRLAGEYKCKGTCVAKYTAVLKNNVTNTVVQNYPSFTFAWPYTFTIAGNYKLEITPICGDKRCTPCVFYFTVN
jgi:hypothetical protein